jgi:hypothetical protein
MGEKTKKNPDIFQGHSTIEQYWNMEETTKNGRESP